MFGFRLDMTGLTKRPPIPDDFKLGVPLWVFFVVLGAAFIVAGIIKGDAFAFISGPLLIGLAPLFYWKHRKDPSTADYAFYVQAKPKKDAA